MPVISGGTPRWQNWRNISQDAFALKGTVPRDSLFYRWILTDMLKHFCCYITNISAKYNIILLLVHIYIV